MNRQIKAAASPLSLSDKLFPFENRKWDAKIFSVIPLGLLHDAHYTQNVPKYLNVGSLGLTLAHEILHSLDKMGRGFDPRGHLRVSRYLDG